MSGRLFISWSQSIRSWKTLENRSFLGHFLSMKWYDGFSMLCMMIVKQSASKNVTMSLFPSCEPLVLVLLLVFTFVFSIFVSVLGAWLHVLLLFCKNSTSTYQHANCAYWALQWHFGCENMWKLTRFLVESMQSPNIIGCVLTGRSRGSVKMAESKPVKPSYPGRHIND